MAATLLASSTASAQALTNRVSLEASLATEFEASFDTTPQRYQRKIRRLRIAGWSMLSLSVAAWVIVPFAANAAPDPGDDGANGIYTALGWGAASLVGLLSAGPLIRAKLLVNRRRRWREAQGLSWDIRIRPDGLDWRLTF